MVVSIHRADSGLVPSQWETQYNAVCHWLGASLGSALKYIQRVTTNINTIEIHIYAFPWTTSDPMNSMSASYIMWFYVVISINDSIFLLILTMSWLLARHATCSRGNFLYLFKTHILCICSEASYCTCFVSLYIDITCYYPFPWNWKSFCFCRLFFLVLLWISIQSWLSTGRIIEYILTNFVEFIFLGYILLSIYKGYGLFYRWSFT